MVPQYATKIWLFVIQSNSHKSSFMMLNKWMVINSNAKMCSCLIKTLTQYDKPWALIFFLYMTLHLFTNNFFWIISIRILSVHRYIQIQQQQTDIHCIDCKTKYFTYFKTHSMLWQSHSHLINNNIIIAAEILVMNAVLVSNW